jgi:hypothetical protein
MKHLYHAVTEIRTSWGMAQPSVVMVTLSAIQKRSKERYYIPLLSNYKILNI